MKLWGRKKKFTLFLLSHLRLQKVQAHSVISALVKMEKALHLYSKRFWEEEGDTTLTSLFFQYRIVILFYFVIVKSPSRVRLFATPWTVAYQAPPSMGFSRQQYWSGLPFPSPEDLPDPGLPHCRTWKQLRCPLTDECGKKLWYIYTMEYYSAMKRNTFVSVLMRWMNLEPIIQSEVSQKEKDKYRILTHIW